MRRLALTLAFVLVALTACAGGGERSVEPGDLRKIVLQPTDLPADFVRFDEGEQLRADMGGGERSVPDRFGREGGWKARYKRSGTAATRGPLLVESRADLFAKTDGAEEDLDAYRRELSGTVAGSGLSRKVVDAPTIGDGAFAVELRTSGTPTVRFFTIAWRSGNVTASVSVNGFELSLRDALALARKQQRRISKAAE